MVDANSVTVVFIGEPSNRRAEERVDGSFERRDTSPARRPETGALNPYLNPYRSCVLCLMRLLE